MLAFGCVVGDGAREREGEGVGLGTAGRPRRAFRRSGRSSHARFREGFGLILFVFPIGLQLGPGFFATLRQPGMKLNMLAAITVILGAAGAPLAG